MVHFYSVRDETGVYIGQNSFFYPNSSAGGGGGAVLSNMSHTFSTMMYTVQYTGIAKKSKM